MIEYVLMIEYDSNYLVLFCFDFAIGLLFWEEPINFVPSRQFLISQLLESLFLWFKASL